MRTRTRIQKSASGTRFGKYTPGTPVPVPSDMTVAGSYFQLEGLSNPRMDRSRYSSITDDTSPSRDYKTVTHYSNQASAFGGTITWSYKDKPSLAHYGAGNIMYSPNIPVTTPNWGGMLDDLAQRVANRSGSAFMLLVTLKELGSTIGMIKNPFGLLKHNWRKSVKGLTARALAKSGSNVWLEQLYGWQSLYHDMTSFAKASHGFVRDLSDAGADEETLDRYSATQVEHGTLPITYGISADVDNWDNWFSNHNNPANYYGIRVHNQSWKTTYRVSCRQGRNTARACSLTNAFLKAADLNTWHGLRDFLWEVTPFSFVADWFVDLRCLWAPFNKDYITSTGANMIGYSTKSECSYSADFSACICSQAFRGLPGGEWYGLYPTSGSGCYQAVAPGLYTFYTRQPGFPPSTKPGSSFLNRGLTLSQWATSAALITQRIL